MRGWLVAVAVLACARSQASHARVVGESDDVHPDPPAEPKMSELARAKCLGGDLLSDEHDEHEIYWTCGARLLRTSTLGGSTSTWAEGRFKGQLARTLGEVLAIRDELELVALKPHSTGPPRVLFKSSTPVEAIAARGSDIFFATTEEIHRLDGGASTRIASAKWVRNIVATERAIIAASPGIVTVIAEGSEPRTLLGGDSSGQLATRGDDVFVGSVVINLKDGKARPLGSDGCQFTTHGSFVFGGCVNGMFVSVGSGWSRIAGSRAGLLRIAANERRLFGLQAVSSGETVLFEMEIPLEYRAQ